MLRRFIGRSMVVMLLLSCWACPSNREPKTAPRGSLTTNTDSRSLPDEDARLAFLARYLRFKSPLADAAFIIRYQDNSKGMVPGPSDWDIRAVLQVEDDTSAWHEGWAPCSAEEQTGDHPPYGDTSWAEPLLDRRARWRNLRSSPRCYRNPRKAASFVIVYEEDDIVLYKNTSE